jgi:L-asparaginase II
MVDSVEMVEVWRGPFRESVHRGHAVVCDDTGDIVQAWGDPGAVVLPRSSSKMVQALPLITSGAAAARRLGPRQLALACASHNAAAIHVDGVRAWLDDLGKTDADFRCGPQEPRDIALRDALIRAGEAPCRIHNNCSGKHAGFLTLSDHMGAGPDYVDPDHPVQRAVKAAFEEVTGEATPGFGIDGCSAPNFATSLHGMARAMAYFAAARDGGNRLQAAAAALRDAMGAHPDLVAGEGRACTELMRACEGRVALKTGAEAFFIAIIPEKKLGVALKITDGGTRAAECAIGAVLIRLGVLDPDHPAARKYVTAPIRNWDGLETGRMRPAEALR